MNKFIELAISNYVREHQNSNEHEVTIYLQGLGYSVKEIEKLNLMSLIIQAKGDKN